MNASEKGTAVFLQNMKVEVMDLNFRVIPI